MNLAILDDHPLIRQGVKSVLEPNFEGFDIMGFESVEAIVSHMAKESIDVVLVDLFLKKASGFEFLRYVQENNPDTKCIVFTSSMEYRDFKQASEMGVQGYVLKDSLPEDLIYAIKSVIRGRAYMDPFFMDMKDEKEHDMDALSEREYQVFELIGKGYNNNEISERLFISVNTVKKHVSQIFLKLGISERTQAAIMANEHFGRRGK